MEQTKPTTNSREQLVQFVDSQYKVYVWRNVAIMGITEYMLYLTRDLALNLEASDEDKTYVDVEMKTAVHYFDCAKERIIEKCNATEDCVLDFQQNFSKNVKRTLNALINATVKNSASIGVTEHIELVSHMAITMKLMEIIPIITNVSKGLSWYKYIMNKYKLDSSLDMLDMSHKHLGKILDRIDHQEHDKPKPNKNIDKKFDEIINKLNDPAMYQRATNFALKASNKQ